MLEKVVVKEIMNWLNAQPQTTAVKIHGGPHQTAGLLDINICCRGRHFELEVKSPTSKRGATPLQLRRIEQVRDAGGYADVVKTLEEAQEVMKYGRLRKAT